MNFNNWDPDAVAKDRLRRQLPKDSPQFDMGLGHEELDDLSDEPEYGRRRIVARKAQPMDHRDFIAWLEDKGIRFEAVFCTARFWCAVVYE